MKIRERTKFFLAVLAVIFALQAMFNGRTILDSATSEALEVFVQRLGIAALIAAGATFFWGQSRHNRSS
jgi:hypothetical protein